MFPETPYKPKLLKKAPSMRAINNYNNIRTTLDNNREETDFAYDNYMFYGDEDTGYSTKVATSEISYHNYANNNGNSGNNSNMGTLRLDDLVHTGKIYLNSGVYGSSNDIIPMTTLGNDADVQMYDYATWKSSTGTGISSETDPNTQDSTSIRKEDLGSTSKLVSAKIKSNCSTCYTYTEILLCTIALTANLGNLYRLPGQIPWGASFIPSILIYILLSLVIGLPLLFLEIGIGQIIQEGLLKTWRAVPFFRGVGYVKLFAGTILSIYYPLYMALSFYYLVYLAKGSLPFADCATVKLTEKGYSADGITGNQCLKKTFLESPYEQPYWFGIYAALVLLVWAISIFLLMKSTRSYTKSLMFLLFPTLATYAYLITVAAEKATLEKSILDTTDWSAFSESSLWYTMAIQVFFSTNVGFGVFITNGIHLYKKANPLLTASAYTVINIILGVGSVILFYSLGHSNRTTDPELPNQIGLLANIYDVAKQIQNDDGPNSENAKIFVIVAYVFFICAGFISTVTLVYTILKSISIDTKRRYKWWQMITVFSFAAFVLGALILLSPRLDIVHLIDTYIVGNLILITVIIDVFGFVLFYGSKRVLSDFEFIMGNKVSKFWIFLWWLIPFLLLGFLIWHISILSLTGDFSDSKWVYGTGWAIVLAAVIFILGMGFYNVSRQDEYYTFTDKFKASVKCSRKWGPIDPIIRYNWVQWHSKAKDGERDFTLKRRGTRDYAHSVKKRSKTYTPALSDASTATPLGTYNRNDQNQNNLKIKINGANLSQGLNASDNSNLILSNNGSSTLILTNGNSTLNRGNSNLTNGTSTVNNGTFIVSNGTSTVNNGTLTVNNGTSTVNNGTSTVNNGTSTVNNETFTVNNGTLTNRNSNSGGVSTASNSTLNSSAAINIGSVYIPNNTTNSQLEPYIYSTNTFGKRQEYPNTLRVTSLVDAMDSPNAYLNTRPQSATIYKTSLNPLAQPKIYHDTLQNDSSNSEGYGTFRKGPYIIGANLDHVCHRRVSEEATEL